MSTRIPASVNINIPEAFREAFGLYTRFPVYILGDKKPGVTPAPVDFKTDFEFPEEQADLSDPLKAPSGAVLWDRFGFKHPDAPDADPVYWMPIVTTAEISLPKATVKTPLFGKNGTIAGTVKEIMALGDHEIVFRGLVINFEDRSKYPTAEVEALNKQFKRNDSIPVASKLLAAHGITNIVMTDEIRWPQIDGYSNIQPFEITCCSDTDIVIELEA